MLQNNNNNNNNNVQSCTNLTSVGISGSRLELGKGNV